MAGTNRIDDQGRPYKEIRLDQTPHACDYFSCGGTGPAIVYVKGKVFLNTVDYYYEQEARKAERARKCALYKQTGVLPGDQP